ncbi:MAG: hypothetical protein HYT72_03575 [Candidatus Aenigmarchaeota archaeon]|nr:hypothetical protein [Candidatus Aenigmarchaeota archaeon]
MAAAINFDRIFFHRRHYGVMLSVIFLVLLVGLAMLYQYQRPKHQASQDTPSISREEAENIKMQQYGGNKPQRIDLPSFSAASLCKEFGNISSEISCEKAAEAALINYSGDILSISKKENSIVGISRNGSTAQIKSTIWIIQMNLYESKEVKLPDGSSEFRYRASIAVDAKKGNAYLYGV